MTDATQDEWTDCPACGGSGVMDGECTCMDDTCCCLEPEPPECGLCSGDGVLSSHESECSEHHEMRETAYD